MRWRKGSRTSNEEADRLRAMGQPGRRLWHLKGMLGHVHWLKEDGLLTRHDAETLESVIYRHLSDLTQKGHQNERQSN